MSNTVNNYTETDLGNISLNPRGEYDDSAAYEYLDTVSYQGGSYFCLAELETTITGIAPDAGHNSEHWQMIAAPGDMTPEYTTAYNDVINKAVQVEASRAAVELAQQEIEAVQTDVQQLHSDTAQAAQEAENSKNSAANSAQSAEQSRKTVSESEQNINGQIAGFDSRVSEAVEQSKEEINTTKQQAINTITNQQTTSVNTVKTEGEKIITRVGDDAKTVADDRVTVEEATQTVLNNAQEVARNAQTVASNTENAAASAESAKTSADNAAQSAKSVEDASKQIEQNKKDVDSLKEDLLSKITKFYASNQGETHITDSDNGKIQDMMIYGKLSQDGTPSPENPVEIKSVVNPTVKVTNEDGLKVQSVTLNNITLNAIPTSSDGNVTIGEQQYISDYVDVEKEKLYRKVKRLNLKDVDDTRISFGFHSNENGYLSISTIENINKEQQPISNQYKSSAWTDKSGYVYIPSDNSIVFVDDRFTDRQTAIKLVQDTYAIYALSSQTEEDLSLEQIKSLKSLSTYYPTTNISVNSEQLDGYTVFNYPIPFEDEWNKTQKEIGGLKEDLTSKADKTSLAQTDRKLDALWKLNQDISYEFQTDEAKSYQKTVPSGAKMANVKSIGGKTIVWNQLADNSHVNDWGETFIANKHYNKIENHMLYFRHKIKVKSVINEQDTNVKRIIVFATTTKIIGNVDIKKDELKAGYENSVSAIEKMPKDITDISVYNCGNDKVGNTAECEASLFVADLTQMFGTGNEPSTPEEFEAMFPADYYPYNAGKLMSASVNKVIYSHTKNQETSYPIPQAILNLPGYGWSAGGVRNEVDWENKQYIQRVDKVDLGTLNWTESGDTQSDGNSTYKSDSLNTVIRRYSTYSGNSICEKFNIVKTNDVSRNEYEYSIGNSEMAYPLQFTVKSTFCTDENDFKNKVNGIMLYYELAELIVTDISDIIGNAFQEPLEVEAGGTLTFKNSHGDDYRIPVPSSEEYVISLAEVAK